MCTSPAATRGSCSAAPTRCSVARPQAVVGPLVQLHCQPEMRSVFFIKMACSAFNASVDSYKIRSIKAFTPRDEQQLAALQQREIGAFVQAVLAFGHIAARGGDELAQVAPAFQMPRQGHQAQIAPLELAAQQEAQIDIPRRLMGPHHSGHRTLIGQCQSVVAQGRRTRHQLLRLRCPALKTEAGQTMQFGIAGQTLCGDGHTGHGGRPFNPAPGPCPTWPGCQRNPRHGQRVRQERHQRHGPRKRAAPTAHAMQPPQP